MTIMAAQKIIATITKLLNCANISFGWLFMHFFLFYTVQSSARACMRLADLQEFKSSQTGASEACAKVSELQVFSKTSEVKVDPDRPLEGARLSVLQARKTLLVPTPRLRYGLLNKIVPPKEATEAQLRRCCSSLGMKAFGVPMGLDAKMKVDLLVVGSVAVSEKGYRIGKGEGYSDMEYAIMVSMGAVNESTVVVTVVHDCQVLDIPEELIGSHDVTVDYILTPTRVIKTNCQLPKPQGIIWMKLDTDKLGKIPILNKLRALEQQAGKDVTLGADRTTADPVTAEPSLKTTQPKRQPRWRPRQNTHLDVKGASIQDLRQEKKRQGEQKTKKHPARVRKESGDNGLETGKSQEKVKEQDSQEGKRKARYLPSMTSIYIEEIPAELHISELKTALREIKATPLKLFWHGAQHWACLKYSDLQAADQALEALQGLTLNGHNVKVKLAKVQQGEKNSVETSGTPTPSAVAEIKVTSN
ncbi:methenyltetrahydrofolate synthase domain-containing protein isoform 1-T1 [Pholidichthys leucotaenia]